MARWSSARWAAAAGFGYIVLSVIGELAPGTSYPKIDDSAATIAAFFHDHHRAVTIAAVLTGLAGPLLIWLFAGIAGAMHNAGERSLAVVVFGLAVLGTAMATASNTLLQAMTRVFANDETVKAVYVIGGYLVAKAFWAAALGAVLIGLAGRRGAFPPWYTWLNFAAAVVFALGGLSVKHSGFFGAGGTMALLAFLALLVWVLASSALLWSRGSAAAPATSI